MKRKVLFATAFAFAAALPLAPAQALNTRSFISANGNDANPCTRPLPCRTLQVAHTNTSAGGEINMLDPAGYGTVVITKSISIVNDGVGSAGILVPSGGTGITINAGPTDKIHLRGLIIEGAGVGAFGIQFNTGASLTIEYCLIRNLLGTGIRFLPSGSTNLAVSNTYVANTGSGILIQSVGAGAVRAVLSWVETHNNASEGVAVVGEGATGGTIYVTAVDSVSSGNFNGFNIVVFNGAPIRLMVVRSVVVNNTHGLVVNGPGATLRISQSTVTGNANGWEGTGVLRSYADNNIDGNDANETAPTTIAKK